MALAVQTWRSSSDLWNSEVERRGPTPQCCPVTPTHAPWHTHGPFPHDMNIGFYSKLERWDVCVSSKLTPPTEFLVLPSSFNLPFLHSSISHIMISSICLLVQKEGKNKPSKLFIQLRQCVGNLSWLGWISEPLSISVHGFSSFAIITRRCDSSRHSARGRLRGSWASCSPLSPFFPHPGPSLSRWCHHTVDGASPLGWSLDMCLPIS